jgi:hypothetical protein
MIPREERICIKSGEFWTILCGDNVLDSISVAANLPFVELRLPGPPDVADPVAGCFWVDDDDEEDVSAVDVDGAASWDGSVSLGRKEVDEELEKTAELGSMGLGNSL